MDAQQADKAELDALNHSVVEQIAAAVDFAFDSPYPELAEAETDVFADSR